MQSPGKHWDLRSDLLNAKTRLQRQQEGTGSRQLGKRSFLEMNVPSVSLRSLTKFLKAENFKDIHSELYIFLLKCSGRQYGNDFLMAKALSLNV